MAEDLDWIRTHCGRMDHGGCALKVGVRNNRIVRVTGDPEGCLNRGYVCAKGLASPDKLIHPRRLRHPLMRVGERGAGQWESIGWDQALSTIAARFLEIRKTHGARAAAFCQGMPKGMEHFVLIRLANLFGSPNVVAVQDVCHAPREITGRHTCGFYPVADFHHSSQLALLWGSNIVATNEEGVICSQLTRALRSGADLMVVDPCRTELAERADLWIPLRPGTDQALALAMLHVIVAEGLFDEDFATNWTWGFDDLARHVAAFPPEEMAPITGVAADVTREAARRYAAARPAALQWGNAIEGTPNNFHAARALICLMAICGNLDVPGGNIAAVEPPVMGLGEFVRADRLPDKRKEMIHAHYGTIPQLMTVPPALFKRAVREEVPYPVKGMYIQCANPMLSWADSPGTRTALETLDFIAVSDIFMTPTAAMADIVLPAATQFEFNDIGHYGLGHGIVLARPKVVAPPPDCRSDMAILNELGRRMTDPSDWFEDPDEMLAAVLKPAGLSFRDFAEKGCLQGSARFRKYRDRGFRTPTGKVELRLSRAEKFNLPPLPDLGDMPRCDDRYPLLLTSAKDPHYLHSSYRWVDRLRRKSPHPLVRFHPDTGRRFGIRDEETVSIETAAGRFLQTARLTTRVLPGVVLAAHGWWFPEEPDDPLGAWDRSGYNMATAATPVGKAFGAPTLRGIPCNLRPEIQKPDADGEK